MSDFGENEFDEIEIENTRDGWAHDAGDYIFTLTRPGSDEFGRRTWWQAQFTEQIAEEDGPDSEECAGVSLGDVIILFTEWPDVKAAFERAAQVWIEEHA
jgi:hypothetical protein